MLDETNRTITYESVKGNVVSLQHDGLDYEVLLNGKPVVTTGDLIEAEIISESIDVALNLLYVEDKLK